MYSNESCFFSKIFFFFYCRLRNLLTVLFSVSHDVLAFFGSLPHSYTRRRGFYAFRVAERKSDKVKRSKRAFFCGDCCDRNQAIILVDLVSLRHIYSSDTISRLNVKK